MQAIEKKKKERKKNKNKTAIETMGENNALWHSALQLLPEDQSTVFADVNGDTRQPLLLQSTM